MNPGDFDMTGTCTGSPESGWCYVEGQAAGTCPRRIIFTHGEPPSGAIVNMQCIEETSAAVGGSI
jgi:hypothetical protein